MLHMSNPHPLPLPLTSCVQKEQARQEQTFAENLSRTAVSLMAMSAPVPSPSASQENRNTADTRPELAILFIGVSLVLGMLCRHIFKGTRVPYTVALLLLGIGLGGLEYGTSHGLGRLGESIRMWSKIDPSLILFVFLPALLFESSFAMHVHQLKRCLVQMVLLAGPGVVISTFSLGSIIHSLFPYKWNWSTSLLLGGLLSATDPVAVVALLRELGASKKLNTIIEGESLMNDGTAIVIFRLFLKMVHGQHFNMAEILAFLSRVSLGAVALGLIFGLLLIIWLGAVFNDTVIEITLTLTGSYIAYYTAEDEASVSGVLTVMTLGIFLAVYARTAFKGESEQSMHYFWEMVAYIANTIIFILSGVVIAESILRSYNNIEAIDWAYLALLYTFLQVSRAVVVITLYPGLRYFGYGLDWKEAIILTWAGLRGAVALSLSLSVHDLGNDTQQYPEKTEALFVFLTGGIVLLSLIINGSTTQFVIHLLHMDKTPDTKLRILEYTRYEMYGRALEAFGELIEDEELGPAEWTTVRKYISCLNVQHGGERPAHPYQLPSPEIQHRQAQLQDVRIQLLNGVQAAYWRMLEEGRITKTAAMILMQSVDEGLDLVVKHEKLLDWEGLKSYVWFPSYLKYFQSKSLRFLPKKLRIFFAVQRLELGCYISAAFLRAHRSSRQQIREFIGESDIAEVVIQESKEEEEAPRQFLEDVQLTFPQVLRVVKTKQVTYAILSHLSDYVESLEKVGLLEEKETNHLHDAVQADLKKLLRKPPLVKMPAAFQTLSSQPFFGALPSDMQVPLSDAAKESVKLRDSVIYKEGSKANGVLLIANGVVKWSKESLAGRHLLHPTFSHGTTLGLYEVLTGKPHLCDLVADSVVHFFFIEAASVLSTLQSNPEVEEFFWQESALAVTKVLLPQLFEAVSMQDLRKVIVDSSAMRIFLWGEVIDILPGEVGILLEGYLKRDGKEDTIAAPHALTCHAEESTLILPGSKTCNLSHEGTTFHAETRSRILVINLNLIRSGQLRRASASFLSRSMPSARHPSFEHGQMRWLDNIHSSGQCIGISPGSLAPSSGRNSKDQSHMSNKLSARALQLGLFGSEITDLNNDSRSDSGSKVPRLPAGKQDMPFSRRTFDPNFLSASILPHPLVEGPSMYRPCSNPQRRHSTASSEGSDAEDDHIVKIDSPSRLFHHPLSHKES